MQFITTQWLTPLLRIIEFFQKFTCIFFTSPDVKDANIPKNQNAAEEEGVTGFYHTPQRQPTQDLDLPHLQMQGYQV